MDDKRAQEIDEALGHLSGDRRQFLKRLAVTTAVTAPSSPPSPSRA